MKILSLTIENCKSYLSKTRINLDNNFNILIGPNAGGKSNTLDIIKIIIRRYLISNYRVQGTGNDKRITQHNIWGNTGSLLDKFHGHEAEDLTIRAEIEVQQNDIDNIKTIQNNYEYFVEATEQLTQSPNIQYIKDWDSSLLSEGSKFQFEIYNRTLQGTGNTEAQLFREYLDYLQLFLTLSRNNDSIHISPSFLHFPPNRNVSSGVLNVSLSGSNLDNKINNYYSSTSRNITSIIEVASLYFARKRRAYEIKSDTEGYKKLWAQDDQVNLVSDYINRIGYDWSIICRDETNNEYSIHLESEDKTLNIGQASSGEKEILNFLLGVFAFRIQGGLILIDEPELHLHPRWQNLLRDLFIELSNQTNNQFVISTHSSVLISSETLPNVRRLSKSSQGQTQVNSLSTLDDYDRSDLLHMVKSHNNERMFFADHVILVEGPQDRVLYERIVEYLTRDTDLASVIEVLSVGGVTEFQKYVRLLEGFGVEVSIVADRDYLDEIEIDSLNSLIDTDLGAIDRDVLTSSTSYDREHLSEALSLAISDENLDDLESFWQYVTRRKTAVRDDLDVAERTRLRRIIAALYLDSTYILMNGRIEDYLPEEYH